MFGSRKSKALISKDQLRMHELLSKNKRQLTSKDKKELKKLQQKQKERDFDEFAFWVEVFSDD
ncbi:MAG: hypothetical protein J6H21_06145 [Firmicutes bacterium]|nr:hypothetical protein [Bacillota bacterium]